MTALERLFDAFEADPYENKAKKIEKVYYTEDSKRTPSKRPTSMSASLVTQPVPPAMVLMSTNAPRVDSIIKE